MLATVVWYTSPIMLILNKTMALTINLRKWIRIRVDVLLARGLEIWVKTVGGFLHFIRQLAHCVFHCVISFFVNIVHIYRVSIRVRARIRIRLMSARILAHGLRIRVDLS